MRSADTDGLMDLGRAGRQGSASGLPAGISPSAIRSVLAAHPRLRGLRVRPESVVNLAGSSRVFRLDVEDALAAATPIVLKLTTHREAQVHAWIADVVRGTVPVVYGWVPDASGSTECVGLLMEYIQPSTVSRGRELDYHRALPPAVAEVHRQLERRRAPHLSDEPDLFRHVVRSAAQIPDLLRFLIAAGLDLDPLLVDELAQIAADTGYHAERCATSPAITLVHRDLQPANVLVAADGTLRIVDWGRAAIGTAELDLVMCDTEAVLAYISSREDGYADDLEAVHARLRSATILGMFEAIMSTVALVFGDAQQPNADGLMNALPFYVERLVNAANSPSYSGGAPIEERFPANAVPG